MSVENVPGHMTVLCSERQEMLLNVKKDALLHKSVLNFGTVNLMLLFALLLSLEKAKAAE